MRCMFSCTYSSKSLHIVLMTVFIPINPHLCIHSRSLVQAEYWQDPFNIPEYKEKCVFLPDINQENVSHMTVTWGSHDSLTLCVPLVLSLYHTLMLLHYHTITLLHTPSHCHTLTLPYPHTATPSHCHTLTLPHPHSACSYLTLAHPHSATPSHPHTVPPPR